jgi:hypothetical protein
MVISISKYQRVIRSSNTHKSSLSFSIPPTPIEKILASGYKNKAIVASELNAEGVYDMPSLLVYIRTNLAKKSKKEFADQLKTTYARISNLEQGISSKFTQSDIGNLKTFYPGNEWVIDIFYESMLKSRIIAK